MRKRVKKSSAWILAAVLCANACATLCGCARTPEATTDENGISYAVSTEESGEAAILDTIKADGTKSSCYTYETDENGRTWCSGTAQTDSNILVLDAEVLSATEVDTISTKTAVADSGAIAKETVLEIFFDGETNVTETEEKSGEDEPNELTMQMLAGDGYTLESADGTKSFTKRPYGGFTYLNHELTSKYKDIELDNGADGGKDEDISENFTAEMAREEVTEIVTQLTNSAIKIVSCWSAYNNMGGYYVINYLPIVDGIPVAENDKWEDTDQYVDVSCSVVIGEEGVASIWATNCLWKITESDAGEEALSLDDALKLLEEYVKENKITGHENLPLTVVALSWLPVTDDWQSARFIPVWRFYSTIEDSSAAYAKDSSTVDGVTNICINAIDGSIVLTEY